MKYFTYLKEYIKYSWIQCTMCGCYTREYRFKKEHFEKLWFFKGKIILCCQCQIIKDMDTRILKEMYEKYKKDLLKFKELGI